MSALTLLVGYANTSSWSLRAWLPLRKTGADFTEKFLRYRTAEGRAELDRLSPTAKLPVLFHDRPEGRVAVWESIAIGDYLAETFPQARLWPDEPVARALARSVAAEMHAGFQPLRNHLSMELLASHPGKGLDGEGVARDIARIQAIWRQCRATPAAKQGPWLFGRFTIADAMYAPVATRFRTYDVPLDDTAAAYVETVYADPDFRLWLEKAETQPRDVAG